MGQPGRAGTIAALQRTIGNRAVQRYFLGAATASASATILQGQDRQADNSFRDATGGIAMSGRDATAGATPLRISEDGRMAIENADASRQAKIFFAEPDIAKKSNTELLKRGSKYLLNTQQAGAITVTDQKGKSHNLDAFEPILNPDEGKKSARKKVAGRMGTMQHGNAVGVEATCVAVAEAIIGQKYSSLTKKELKALKLVGATQHTQWGAGVADTIAKGGKRKAQTGALNENAIAQAYGQYLQAHPAAAAKTAKKLGVNVFADPKVGQAFVSESMGTPGAAGITNWTLDPTGGTSTALMADDAAVAGGKRRTGWGNHAGAVVAASGGDKVTMENYARSGEDAALKDNDEIFYFAMYGPVTKPTQTWHATWSGGATPIANAVTGVIG
ncbi:MAG: hypothetical protein IT303_19385 [Dehalococcoidia bacterium]|nr:hypothetical protein [Dehalococcoidia bacterium]